jgi:hypothetical protein
MTPSPATTAALPALDADYALTPGQIAAFRRDGHVRLPGLLSRAEVDAWRPVMDAAIMADFAAQDPKRERTPEERLFPGVTFMWRRHEACKRFAFARRFTKTVADLFGCRALRLYADGSMFKEPGGPGTDWHQDGFYMPMVTDSVATLWIALNDVTAEMGTLSFASGSHEDRQAQTQGFSPTSVAHLEAEMRARGRAVVDSGDMAAGDATIHLKWTAHAVAHNRSVRRREAVSLIYVDAEARTNDSLDPTSRMMVKCNIGDVPPGAMPDERSNPTVYTRG